MLPNFKRLCTRKLWNFIFGLSSKWHVLILYKFTVQFINVYEPKYETAGKFWPIVHNSMIFSLVLMHCIAVGIFTLKKLSLAPTLIFPLPILTLLFNEYCRKRFLPIFIAYSAEVCIQATIISHHMAKGYQVFLFLPPIFHHFSPWHWVRFLYLQSLIKKDREDQHDATMNEFFDKLVTAYQDPALMPIQFSTNADSLNSPLLSSTEVWAELWSSCTILRWLVMVVSFIYFLNSFWRLRLNSFWLRDKKYLGKKYTFCAYLCFSSYMHMCVLYTNIGM